MRLTEKIDFIISELSEAGFSVSSDQATQLLQYYEMLVEKNQVMNLTAITDFGEVIRKHFADSLALSKYQDFHNIHRVIDIGTGAGFPGMVLKIAFPEISLTLLDSLAKRIHFLEEVADTLGLQDVEFVHARTEDAAGQIKYREQYDLAVSRAVARLNVLSEYCIPYVKTGGLFVAYKGGEIQEELRNSENAVQLLGGHLQKVETFQLFDMLRSLVFIEKQKPSPKRYPRKAGMPSKNPL